MRRQTIMRIGIAVSLISALVVGRADVGFAHVRATAPPSASLTGRPPAVAFRYTDTLKFSNWIEHGCLSDDRYAIYVGGCIAAPDAMTRWGFTQDYIDGVDGNEVGTFQNQYSGSCLDDSAEFGLRDYYCHQAGDPSRGHQQFKRTYNRQRGYYVLQNMVTGSCVDYSRAYGLRGYYCLPNDYFQAWVPLAF